jgi:hypothetical protein
MRTLDNNLFKTGTLEATFPDPNYPKTNLFDNTLLSLFKTEDGEDTTVLTLTFDSDVSVSCWAIANHNIDTGTITLKDSGASTIYSKSYTTGQLAGTTRDYFPATYSTVRSIEISLTTLETTVSIGGIYAGQYTQFPYINVAPEIGQTLTGGYAKTRGGYLTGQSGVKLESFSCVLSGVSLSDQDVLSSLFEAAQTNTAIYLDRYEESTADYPLLFVNITNSGYTGSKGVNATYLDEINLSFEEVK